MFPLCLYYDLLLSISIAISISTSTSTSTSPCSLRFMIINLFFISTLATSLRLFSMADHHQLLSPSSSPSLSPTLNSSLNFNNIHDQSGSGPPAHVDFNVMVIVAAMLCALVCALGLNSMLQCVFQCTYRAVTEPRQWVVSRRLNSGLRKKEMVALPTSTYANSSGNSPSSASGCAICLLEFMDGDKIRLLPKCNHLFHVACIDKWLLSHSSCPTCRQRLNNPNQSITVPSLDQIVTA